MKSTFNPLAINKSQLTVLIIMRIAIGWHFLYEGIIKLYTPNWTSIGFLLDSQGPASGLFHAMTNSSLTVHIIDILNIWGLILIGLGLILGVLTQVATVSGILLLLLYYISHPPLASTTYMLPNEGSYLLVNKNLIEMIALAVLYVFPTGKKVGIDRLIDFITKKK